MLFGEAKTRSFSIGRLGVEAALAEAIAYEDSIAKLRQQSKKASRIKVVFERGQYFVMCRYKGKNNWHNATKVSCRGIGIEAATEEAIRLADIFSCKKRRARK